MKGMVIYTGVLLAGLGGYFFWLHQKAEREGAKVVLREGSLAQKAHDFFLEPQGAPELNTPTEREEVWELSRKVVAERLKGAGAVKFCALGEPGAGARDLGNGVWLVRGYVEAKRDTAAMQRTDWEAHLVTREGRPHVVALRLGKDQTGDPQIALRLASAEEREALAANPVGAARGSLAEEKAIQRATFHRQARTAIEKWLASKASLQHSTLQPRDDAYTACRELGGSIWEARGVMQTTGAQPERAPWRVLFSLIGEDAIQPRFLEIGKHRSGDEAAVLKTASAAKAAPRPTPARAR